MFAFIMRVLGQITAITKRKNAEDRVREREARRAFRAVAHAKCGRERDGASGRKCLARNLCKQAAKCRKACKKRGRQKPRGEGRGRTHREL